MAPGPAAGASATGGSAPLNAIALLAHTGTTAIQPQVLIVALGASRVRWGPAPHALHPAVFPLSAGAPVAAAAIGRSEAISRIARSRCATTILILLLNFNTC